ncbi:MAG: LysR substrate-binding domain-containing protein [Candidatus Pacebacteria bacterium]|nr:LysR substrate-binding domain-containing protein [Candidatus Paceibacterota bacterium]
MNLRDLDYIIAVAEFEHFGKAADSCHISQPTLSTQISKIEAELGVKIFERNSRSLQITAIGATIIARARAIQSEVREIHNLAAAERDPMGGSLRLGIIPTLSPYLAPLLLPPLARACPRLSLEWHEDMTHSLVTKFLNFDLDFMLLATLPESLDSDEFLIQPLFTEPFYLALPRTHRLAAATSLAMSDLMPSELLLLAEGHCLRDQIVDLCSGPALRQPTANDFRAASLETLLALVEHGLGVTLVPALALPTNPPYDSQGLVFRPLGRDGGSRQIRLITRHSFGRPKLRWELAKTIQSHLPKTVTIVNSL